MVETGRCFGAGRYEEVIKLGLNVRKPLVY